MTAARLRLAALAVFAGAALFGAGLLAGLSIGGGPHRLDLSGGRGEPKGAPAAATPLAASASPTGPASGSRAEGSPAFRAERAARPAPASDRRATARGSTPLEAAETADERAKPQRAESLDEVLKTIDSHGFAESCDASPLKDRRVLEEALARFRIESDPRKLEVLAFLLAQIANPDVEALAVDLAARGDRDHRLATLGILERFETPAAIPVATQIIRAERDPVLVAAAIHALPEAAGVSSEAAGPVAEDLRAAAASPDAEVRRRALIALATWLPAGEAEPLIAAALRDDRDPGVRAGAAYGLEILRPRLRATIALLAAVVARREEDRLVRENAWRALGAAGPLPAESGAIYEAFREEMEGR